MIADTRIDSFDAGATIVTSLMVSGTKRFRCALQWSDIDLRSRDFAGELDVD